MRTECGVTFDVVRGVCNGTKHVETDGSHAVAFRAGADTIAASDLLVNLSWT